MPALCSCSAIHVLVCKPALQLQMFLFRGNQCCGSMGLHVQWVQLFSDPQVRHKVLDSIVELRAVRVDPTNIVYSVIFAQACLFMAFLYT